MNYEEKYKNALERASKLRVQNPFDTVGQMVEHIFPELAESEDERIRKRIIHALHGDVLELSEINEALAWLEKQKSNTNKKEIDDAYLQGICDAKHEIEKQGGHKPTDKVEPKTLNADEVIAWLVGNIIDFEDYVRAFKQDFGL